MNDGVRRARRGRCPFGLIGALALIVAVEIQIDRHKMACLGGSHWGYEVARSEAETGSKDCDVLCFGDSLLKQGLAPTVIEARSGLRAYNFAEAGGQAPGSYLLLKRAIESGARPSAIVVNFFPSLMAENPRFNMQNWPFVASLAESLELGWIVDDPKLLGHLAARKFLPSLRCRNSIRFNLLLAFDGNFGTLRNEILRSRRQWRVNRGAEIVASRPDRAEDLESWVRGYFPRFHCARSNRAYINKFLDLAARHEVPVFWVLPPYKRALQDRCERSGFDADHEAFIRSMQSRHPLLFVIDGRHSGYATKVFTDFHHLSREGASVHSADIADLLRRHRDRPESTPRWIKLPGYREMALIVPLEDREESLAWAVRGASDRRESKLR